MREDLLNELEAEYEVQRLANEKTEAARRERIRQEFPQIEAMLSRREEMIFGTVRKIFSGDTDAANLTEQMEELNRGIRSLLRQNGLPEDYLAPVYRCEKCRDTGYRGDLIREPCECLTALYQKKIRESIGLQNGKPETFETFDEELIPDTPDPATGISQRKQTVFVRNVCEKWADSYPDTEIRDLLLTGQSGLGKTFLLHAMVHRLIARGHNVLMVSAYHFLQMARKSYFDAENGVQELMEVPVLMLDDLGSEPMMQNVTIEQLFHLLNERQARNLCTIISTNLSLEELRKRYTERIVSRLNHPKRCMILTLDGQNLRKLER